MQEGKKLTAKQVQDPDSKSLADSIPVFQVESTK
jgi:hypothetical protein